MKLLIAITVLAFAACSSSADDGVLVSDVAEKALQQSQITLPGSKPFHLVAIILETTDPRSEPRAKIEEYWLSPATGFRRSNRLSSPFVTSLPHHLPTSPFRPGFSK